jgi:type IV pilus assembly protein PilC
LGLVVVILTAMLVFVVPVFKKMYKQLGGTLPAPTRVLMAISNTVVHGLPFVIVGAVLAVVGIRRWRRTPGGRRTWDRLVLRIPVFGGLVRKTALARFASTLSTLLSSGVPILEALDITKDTADNTLVAEGVTAIADGARRGDPMHQSLEGYPIFPPMITQMIRVGEETGALDDLLAKVAGFFEQEVEAMVSALTSLLEPMMIMVLGGAVGSTIISLYLPMFDIYKLVAKSG